MTSKKSVSSEAVGGEQRRKRRTMSQSDTIELWNEYGVLVPERLILLGSVTSDIDGNESGTDAAMFERFYRNLRTLRYFDSKSPITIVMNNLGGDWYHGMGIYGAIANSPCQINIEVYGRAMSMGSIILQAATGKRLIDREATMMLHYGSDGFEGHTKDFEKRADEAKRMNMKMEDIYLSRMTKKDPSITRERLQDAIKYDYYLEARDAIKLGLADGYIVRPTWSKQKNESPSS